MNKQRTIMPLGRYTDDELELFKQVFAENLPLIKTVRRVMLQLDMSEAEEIQWHKTFENNEPLNALMRKLFLPTLDGDSPLSMGMESQVIDLWMTIQINDKLPEEAQSIIDARQLVIDYLDFQLEVLAGNKKNDKNFIKQFDVKSLTEIRARNTIIGHTESQLATINTLAGFKQETAEETIKRLQANSNK